MERAVVVGGETSTKKMEIPVATRDETSTKNSEFIRIFVEKQKSYRQRIDLTEHMKYLPEFRRLDALARLLEYKTNCVAVTVFNKQLIISSNENSREFEELIQGVCQYFYNIAIYNRINKTEREQIFKSICNINRFKLLVRNSKMAVHEQDLDEITHMILQDENYTISELLAEGGRNLGFAIMFIVGKDLYKDLIKIENFIIQANSKTVVRELVDAFKEKYILLYTKQRSYHAEMQIVFHLLNKGEINPPYYIGISKPCCVKCHFVLQHFNDIFLRFLVRGWHDHEEENWEIPKEEFKKMLNNRYKSYDDFLTAITNKIDDEDNRGAPGNSSKGSATRYKGSDSVTSQSGEEIATEDKVKLDQIKRAFDLLGDDSLSLKKIKKMIEIGSLFYTESIKDFYLQLYDDLYEVEIQHIVIQFIESITQDQQIELVIDENISLIIEFFKSEFFNSPIKKDVCRILQEIHTSSIPTSSSETSTSSSNSIAETSQEEPSTEQSPTDDVSSASLHSRNGRSSPVLLFLETSSSSSDDQTFPDEVIQEEDEQPTNLPRKRCLCCTVC